MAFILDSDVHVTNTAKPGNLLDDYLIEKLVAEGGMASVYRATNVKNGAQVAIKIPHLEAESDPVFFDRFMREDEIGKRLDHPGVMKVFSGGERSRMYMVMEWARGRSRSEEHT